MIVVDSNIIVYFLVTGDNSALAQQVFAKDPEWAAPMLWRSEFCNVLSMYLRKQIIPAEDAFQILAKGMGLMDGREYHPDTRHILELSMSSGCTTYDCEFVALADELIVSLVTTDRQVLAAFPDKAISLEAFIDN